MYHTFLVFRATHDKLIQVSVILANWVQQQFCILVNSTDANTEWVLEAPAMMPHFGRNAQNLEKEIVASGNFCGNAV